MIAEAGTEAGRRAAPDPDSCDSICLAERVGFEPTVPCDTHAFQACSFGHSDTSPESGEPWMAEREGFEPSEALRPHWFSKPARSANSGTSPDCGENHSVPLPRLAWKKAFRRAEDSSPPGPLSATTP